MIEPRVYTSYYRKIDDLLEHVTVLQVSNSQPEYSKFEINKALKFLAPKWEYVQALKDNLITWEKFEELYRAQLSEYDLRPVRETLDDLVRVTQRPIILACWEKDSKKCHRSILASVLGYEDIEL